MSVIKLSEAIREGAKLRPQGRNAWFAEAKGGQIYSCALGAAYEALFGLPPKNENGLRLVGDKLESIYPELEDSTSAGIWLCNEISRRNDCMRQTREQIADWLQEQGC